MIVTRTPQEPTAPGRVCAAATDREPDHTPDPAEEAAATDGGEARPAALIARIRRLELDNEDLRFERARLEATILANQQEAAALARRIGALQRQLDIVNRLTAFRHTRWFRFVARHLPRRNAPSE